MEEVDCLVVALDWLVEEADCLVDAPAWDVEARSVADGRVEADPPVEGTLLQLLPSLFCQPPSDFRYTLPLLSVNTLFSAVDGLAT